MQFKHFEFGAIDIDGVIYEHDLVVDRGEIYRRKKKASKKFRETFGHTPLSAAEKIPWKCRRLVIGTGAYGRLPVMDDVKREAKDRDQAQELAELIDNKTVVVRLKVGAEDKVFGAITNEDIATALRLQHQVDVDRRKIDLKDPLKQLGEHQVPLRLHRDVDAHINLIITQDR